MTRLSVNVNKIASLRNSRGGEIPNLKQVTLDCERFGAQGITMHPRPDERHIRYADVREIRPLLSTEFNIEGYPSENFLKLVEEVHPEQVTLVPDPPHVLTSNAGWIVRDHISLLNAVVTRLKKIPTRVSLFIDPKTSKSEDFKIMKEMGVDRIELYTEAYAKNYGTQEQEKTLQSYFQTALQAKEFGLDINAGHDLNTENLRDFVQKIPIVEEVSIGHALVADALYEGLEKTIQNYLAKLD